MIMGNLLSIISLLITGLVLPLVFFLIKRKPELRQTNAETDATLITSSGMIITQLQGQIKAQEERIAAVEAGRVEDLTVLTSQLERAHTENARCASQCASLRTDLDIAYRQIDELRRHLPGTR